MPRRNPQLKMYLTLISLSLIIIIAWAFNLKKSIQANQSSQTEDVFFINLNNNWQQVNKNLNHLYSQFKQKANPISQAATSSDQLLQPVIQLDPEHLNNLIGQFKSQVTASHTAATTTLMHPATSSSD